MTHLMVFGVVIITLTAVQGVFIIGALFRAFALDLDREGVESDATVTIIVSLMCINSAMAVVFIVLLLMGVPLIR